MPKLPRVAKLAATKSASGPTLWPSRDPIGEEGHELLKQTTSSVEELDTLELEADLNPYGIAGNDIVNRYDVLGEAAPAVGAGIGIIVRELAKYAAKRAAKRIAECEGYYHLYKKVGEPGAAGCKPCLTCPEYVKLLSYRALEVLNRTLYLKRKCDYILTGSRFSKEGSREKERTHTIERNTKVGAFGNCTAYAVKAGCTNLPSLGP